MTRFAVDITKHVKHAEKEGKWSGTRPLEALASLQQDETSLSDTRENVLLTISFGDGGGQGQLPLPQFGRKNISWSNIV